jgi:hypothetical protein
VSDTALEKQEILFHPTISVLMLLEESKALSTVHVTKKRLRIALLIVLPFLALLAFLSADSVSLGLLSAGGAVVLFVLEFLGVGWRSWFDEEVKPRKGEGSGGLL